MFRTSAILTLILAGITSANDNVPPGKQPKPLLIVGATIHPVSEEPVPAGQLLIVDGKVAGVFAEEADFDVPPDTVAIELPADRHIYPGMIAANSVLGLTEINAVRATVDVAEPGAINPNARAQVSINPDSELIPVTRANGVLASLAIPRTNGGLIGGQGALIRLDGWTWEEMTVEAPVGMHVYWPQLREFTRWTTNPSEEDLKKMREAYDEAVEKLEKAFADARAYAKAAAAEETKTDLRWEALKPVLAGELKLFIHAQTAAQIQDALHFTAKEEIDAPVIVGGRDAWRLTTELAAQNASVILSPVNDLPRRWEAYDTPYTAASKLHAAEIPFCIANSGSTFQAANERNLPYQAARAAAHGLDPDIALKSVTLFPAQILGVEDRLGSLADGREATFFVTNGDPLEVRTSVERAWVRGREIDLSSRHTRLFEKYKEKYRQQDQE